MTRAEAAKKREENEIEFSRIVAFSDGVFAIAITLLVLNLTIPKDLHGETVGAAIWNEREAFIAYGISFAVIGRYWLIHHRLFGEVTGFDGRLLGLNLFYLGWVVLVPFSSEVIGDHANDTGGIVVYAINLAVVAVLGWVMAADAHRAGLTRFRPEDEREYRYRAFFVAIVFIASIPVAFVAPRLAPFLWLALFFDPVERFGVAKAPPRDQPPVAR
ncbi:MAG TPA: TMEM175 family protein [Solirubrobacterales bacterium]